MNPVIEKIKANIEQVIVGKGEVIDLVLTALVARGHVLIEDMPGTGKTMLAKSLAASMEAAFNRIQFTPDLLPSDVTGLSIFNQKENIFEFHKGPIFSNIILADEINRATPRTQASLLECMEERQVTTDGVTRKLEEPFFVVATQNPIETAGTFPLPEAQLDRFMMKLSMGTLSEEQEEEMLFRFAEGKAEQGITPVCTVEEIRKLQEQATKVYIHKELLTYIREIASETRNTKGVVVGVSPRASIALLRASQSLALIKGRTYVVSEDIKSLAPYVFAHRLLLEQRFYEPEMDKKYMNEILERVSVPTEEWKNQ